MLSGEQTCWTVHCQLPLQMMVISQVSVLSGQLASMLLDQCFEYKRMQLGYLLLSTTYIGRVPMCGSH